jgi:hypothetical protein
MMKKEMRSIQEIGTGWYMFGPIDYIWLNQGQSQVFRLSQRTWMGFRHVI